LTLITEMLACVIGNEKQEGYMDDQIMDGDDEGILFDEY